MRTEPLFVDSVLARRLELAEAKGGASCGFALAPEKPETGPCVETIAGGRAVFTGVGSLITQATGIGLDGEVTAEEFARWRISFLVEAQMNVETSPYADASLFLHYAKSGYCATEFTSVLVRRVGEPLQSINSGSETKGVVIDRAEESELDL